MKRTLLALAFGLALPAFAAQADEPATAKDGRLVDAQGMTLYTFDKDSGGQSACSGQCEQFWPPLAAGNAAVPGTDWSVVIRDDGRQWAYHGKPLYRFVQDKKPGDASGEGKMNGAWHVARP